MKDYYHILGIERNAPTEEVKKAYRKLAHKYHPDKLGGDEAKFKEINEAYQVLGDVKKRATYDQFGSADGSPWGFGGFGARGGEGFPDFGGSQVFTDFGDLGEVFESFFEGLGVRPKRRTYQHGSDVEVIHEISLHDAFRGTTVFLRVPLMVRCDTCKGKGGDEKEGEIECEACRGRGEIREERRTFFGSFSQVRACAKCNGAGKIFKKTCTHCKGTGKIHGVREVNLDILPGIQHNQIIHVKGMGEAGERGAPSGDLYVRVTIRSHTVFERKGDDLVVRKELDVRDLLLGTPLEVPTIDGAAVSLEIPAGYNLKDFFRYPGKGMPRFGSAARGDLLVDFILKVPKKLNEKQRKTLEDL